MFECSHEQRELMNHEKGVSKISNRRGQVWFNTITKRYPGGVLVLSS